MKIQSLSKFSNSRAEKEKLLKQIEEFKAQLETSEREKAELNRQIKRDQE